MAMEKIIVSGVTEILKPLISLISQQISLAWGVKDDLRKLKETLESIQALITSAEERQANDPTVGLWLRRLKDVIYDADDVMDEFSYETKRPSKNKVRALVSSSNPISFQFTMARKIRAINKRLDEICKNSDRYRLQNMNTAQDKQTREKRNRLTSSIVDDSIFLGREGDKSDIINLLMDKSSPSISSSSSGISYQPQSVSSLSIVGMGGLGKTTLAQMVYKDVSIVRNFEPRAWVCVSDTFDIYKILRDIIESITKTNCGDSSNVDVLANRVNEKLNGKKYLLVLDDLWNEDVGDWEKLKSFLVCGAMGSKILVSTRNQKVASAVGGTMYNLKKLPDDVCWSIMERKVLSQGGTLLSPEMIDIGRDIAGKCDGLPLAANSLGSLMCSKRNQSFWSSIVNNNDLWSTPEHKKVISVLKLSFDNLSSRLKQCFSYCCIFPRDWDIDRDMLIRLWMAEGFLLPSSGGENISLEDIGNEFFEYLVWSSFFQDVKRDEELGDIKTCKMHDLVHDLATSVLDCNEFGIAKVDGKADFSEVRRLRLMSVEGQNLALSNAMKLRTIFAFTPMNYLHINSFFRNRHLRILCLLGGRHRTVYRSFEIRKLCFASLISKLKHLRYLDLSWINTREVSLNNSYNLQTLILHACKNVPSWLLSKIGSLKSLRHLDISDSDIKVLPENIGSLEHLSCLDISGTPISKLPDSITCITNLRKLNLSRCKSLDALPRELGALTQLRYLDLIDTSIKVLPESCIRDLCNLEIVNLGDDCELPEEITNWPKLRIFRHYRKDDAMPRGIERLTCLETLAFYNVRKENGSSSDNFISGVEELGGLDSLQVLIVRNLENVRGGTEGAERAKLKDKQHLRELYLLRESTDDDDEEVRNRRSVKDSMVLEGLQPHSNLEKLFIIGFSGVKLPKWMMGCSLPNCLPNLVKLHLEHFDNCEHLPGLGMLLFLRFLVIDRLSSIKYLGKEFYYEQKNDDIEKGINDNTTRRSSLFPSLVELNIIELENLEEWVASPISACFPSLEILNIYDCRRYITCAMICIRLQTYS